MVMVVGFLDAFIVRHLHREVLRQRGENGGERIANLDHDEWEVARFAAAQRRDED